MGICAAHTSSQSISGRLKSPAMMTLGRVDLFLVNKVDSDRWRASSEVSDL